MFKNRFDEFVKQYDRENTTKDLSSFSHDKVWNQKTLDDFFKTNKNIKTEKFSTTTFFNTPITFYKDQIELEQDDQIFQLTRLRAEKFDQEYKSFILSKNPEISLMAASAFFSTSPSFKNVVIMPDGHITNTNIVGFTSRATKNKNNNFILSPMVIGSDIGCGVLSANFSSNFDQLSEEQIPQFLKQLDKGIINLIPAGQAAEHSLENLSQGISFSNTFSKEFYSLLKKQVINFLEQSYFFNNLPKNEQKILIENIVSNTATLGDGNHFIEINKNNKNQLQLNIHSGSRTFGAKVYQYYQNIAKQLHNQQIKYFKKQTILEARTKYNEQKITLEEFRDFLETNRAYIKKLETQPILNLEDDFAKQYFHDLKIAESYACFNREMMMLLIEEFIRKNIYQNESLAVFEPHYHNIHNSAFKIADEIIILKGAILAQISNITNNPENLHPNAIPLNMRDGIINTYPKYDITSGSQFNFSLPHGAGRNFSRKQFISQDKNKKLNDFKNMMNQIVSSCVLEETLDESPNAYKSKNDILEQSAPLFEQNFQIFKPIYSFKGHAKLPFMMNIIQIKNQNRDFIQNIISEKKSPPQQISKKL